MQESPGSIPHIGTTYAFLQQNRVINKFLINNIILSQTRQLERPKSPADRVRSQQYSPSLTPLTFYLANRNSYLINDCPITLKLDRTCSISVRYMMTKICHDVKIMWPKSWSWYQKHVITKFMTPKVCHWRQKHAMSSKKFVMTQKVRHDVKKSTSWFQKHFMTSKRL